MYKKHSGLSTEAEMFEADYLLSTQRARRDFSWAKRAAVIATLNAAPPDARRADPDIPQAESDESRPRLRSFSLIVARCESAATLLSWRDSITPGQKLQLDAAVQRVLDAATQVAVRSPIHPMNAKRAKFGRDLRTRVS